MNAYQAYAFQPLGTTNPGRTTPRYNNFGWMFGGPIFIPGHFNVNRDKLFFFVGQDFKRLRTSTITTTTVPTAAQKNGDFSAFPTSQWPINPARRASRLQEGLFRNARGCGLGLMQHSERASAGDRFLPETPTAGTATTMATSTF